MKLKVWVQEKQKTMEEIDAEVQKLHDYWAELDWIDNNITYQKPIYDPYETFKPTKSFIREVLRGLRGEAYRLIESIQEIERMGPWGASLLEDGGLFREHYQSPVGRHRKIVSIIRQHLNYLKGNKSSPGFNIAAAKQRPIQDFFLGKLRRVGRKLIGPCPFHQDDSPSFTIYIDQNSWHCYGCQANGDVIDFVQQTRKLSFKDAINLLT